MARRRSSAGQSFIEGLGIGAANFRSAERNRINLEELQRQQTEKVVKSNQEKMAFFGALGLNPSMNSVTGEIEVTGRPSQITTESSVSDVVAGKGQFDVSEKPFQRQPATREALLISQMSPEGRQAFNKFLKREEPAKITDTHFSFSRDRIKGERKITAIEKSTGDRVVVGDDVNGVPKKVDSFIGNGKFDVGGEQVGVKGRKTRVIKFDDGSVQFQDLGKVSKDEKASTNKDLEFELDIANMQERVDNVKVRLSKSTGGLELASIKSDLDALSLQVAELGSPEAQKKIVSIFNRGKTSIGSSIPTRAKFYEIEKENLVDEWLNGDWTYQDAQTILKFLEFKYQLFPTSGDQKKDTDEFNFDNFNLEGTGVTAQ